MWGAFQGWNSDLLGKDMVVVHWMVEKSVLLSWARTGSIVSPRLTDRSVDDFFWEAVCGEWGNEFSGNLTKTLVGFSRKLLSSFPGRMMLNSGKLAGHPQSLPRNHYLEVVWKTKIGRPWNSASGSQWNVHRIHWEASYGGVTPFTFRKLPVRCHWNCWRCHWNSPGVWAPQKKEKEKLTGTQKARRPTVYLQCPLLAKFYHHASWQRQLPSKGNGGWFRD